MAELDCIVRGFDPDSKFKNFNSTTHNLFLYQGAIMDVDCPNCPEFPQYTYEEILKKFGDIGKHVTYLKMDIEGHELSVFPQMFKSNVLEYVNQIGFEVHAGMFKSRAEMEKELKIFFEILGTLYQKYGFELASYNPNGCLGKDGDVEKMYYSYFDVLLVKSPKK